MFFKEKYYFYNLQILYLYFFKKIYEKYFILRYFNNISNAKDKYNFFDFFYKNLILNENYKLKFYIKF
jgi:hypothetical protein